MSETKKTLQLEVITPDAVVLQEKVDFIIARALDGDIGILPGHTAMISALDIQEFSYDQDGTRNILAVSAGFLEVHDDVVTILTPAAERPTDIDLSRANSAKDRAEHRLHDKKDSDIDVARAELALKRALCRIHVVNHYRGQ